MTEVEWLEATEPEPMLAWAQRNGLLSRHKLAVFFVSCCDCLKPLIANEPAPMIINWHDEDSPDAMTDAMRHLSDAVWESIRMLRIKTGDCALLAANIRDIFGPFPFRSITLKSAWLISTVVALANAIYKEKAFDYLPVLADALQDAGCDIEYVLNHCRQPSEHVRGCWVVDLLTGRT